MYTFYEIFKHIFLILRYTGKALFINLEFDVMSKPRDI